MNELFELNKTELIQMCRRAGMGDVSRELSREEIIDLLVEGDEEGDDELSPWRRAMEAHIRANKKRLLSQLPGCNGKCTTFGCPDLIVTRCWDGFSQDMV
jgi:hypothetical protein